ncbi:MAG: hypothetical protein KDK91_01700 [Gammaproteobacteria bacterium]|nr:hypothetical protein [Gammaproteobacteria bacterium]
MIEVEQLTAEHIERMPGLMTAAQGLGVHKIESMEGRPGVAVVSGDDVIACGGVTILWPGVGELWAAFDAGHPQAAAAHVALVRAYRKGRDDLGLWRCQATIDAHNDVALLYASRACWGMHSEGLMRMYGPAGEDCVRMAWTRPRGAH